MEDNPWLYSDWVPEDESDHQNEIESPSPTPKPPVSTPCPIFPIVGV